MTKASKVTSFDIAYQAGLSQSTVSRALNNSPLVNRETRLKVQRIARELNYKVDKNAANLRTQKSKTLALLLFEDVTSDDSNINPFFLQMLGHITRGAAQRGYDLLVSFQKLDEDWHTEYELSSRADGMILLGYGDYVSYREKLVELQKSEAHFIIWGPDIADQPGHSLGCDNELGGYLATHHLLDLGFRNIAFIGDISEHCPEFALRYQGYCKALKEAGLTARPELQADAMSEHQAGATAIETLLESGTRFDSLFAASDLIALDAIKAMRKKGFRVPVDFGVVGFDDIPAASYTNPALTTISQDTAVAGQMLVDHLIRLIDGEAVESTLIAPKLVERGSTKRVE